MASRLLLKSSDRTSGTSTDFVLTFKDTLFSSYVLQWSVIPHGVYTVRTGVNDKIYLTENAVSLTATLSPGNYTATTLATEIAAQLNGTLTDATNTVTLDDSTQKYTFDFSTNTHTVGFEWGTYTTASARVLLGFNEADVAAATTQVSTNMVDMSTPREIGVRIREAQKLGYKTAAKPLYSSASSYIRQSQNPRSGTLVFPLTVPFGALNYHTALEHHAQRVDFYRQTKTLHVTLIDPDTEQELDINGLEWSMLLIGLSRPEERPPKRLKRNSMSHGEL